jgi:hypothetical protein
LRELAYRKRVLQSGKLDFHADHFAGFAVAADPQRGTFQSENPLAVSGNDSIDRFRKRVN